MNENDLNISNRVPQQPLQPEMPSMEIPVQPEMPSMEAPAQPEMPSMEIPAQPEMPSMEAPAQPEMPKMEDLVHQSESVPTVNFMDDFSEAVTTDPEPEIVTIQTPEMSFATDSTLGTNPLEESQKEEVAVQPEIVSVETPSENSVSTLDPILNPTSTVESVEQVDTPLEVGQITQEEVKSTKKKKSNWPFIILLFSIVGVCVLLFPVLVRIFGY